MKPEYGDIRHDGKKWDGHTWRKNGVNHQMDEKGRIFYKVEWRTIEGYLQQGGSIDKIIPPKGIESREDMLTLAKSLEDKVLSGDVYIITNPSYPEWICTGKASVAQDRCNGYQTGSPFRDYELRYYKWFKNRTKSEKDFQKLLTEKAEECRGEWFKISVEDAKEVLDSMEGKLIDCKEGSLEDFF